MTSPRQNQWAVIGVLLAGIPHFQLAEWRIPGVLQRLGLAYLGAALLVR